MSNNTISCAVIRDLLPLYHDSVVSEETKAIIGEHLEGCEECKKEYERLCADLPLEARQSSTKNRFIKMMNKKRVKQILVSITCVVMTCALLLGGLYVQYELPFFNVPNDEISVERVYRYKTEDGYGFFIMYDFVPYECSSGQWEVQGDTLIYNIKKPLIALSKKVRLFNIDKIEIGNRENENGEIIYGTFSTVKVGEEVVWTTEKNANDVVPEYVYAYVDYKGQKSEVNGWLTNEDYGWMAALYDDEILVKWDFDGNVLEDNRPQQE